MRAPARSSIGHVAKPACNRGRKRTSTQEHMCVPTRYCTEREVRLERARPSARAQRIQNNAPPGVKGWC
eukprot:scaffold106182_cov35-Tisochrysis_lutea.AAC.3